VRVLVVTDFFPPALGGMERHVQGLACSLAERGHDVVVAVASNDEEPTSIQEELFPVIYLGGFPTYLPGIYHDRQRRYPIPATDPLLLHRLRRLASDFKPDIVHAHGWSAATTLALDLPVVVTLHDYGLFCPKRSFLHRGSLCQVGPGVRCIGCGHDQYGLIKSAVTYLALRLSRRSLQRTRHYIAVSSFVRETYLRYAKLNPQSITVVPNFYWEDESPTDMDNFMLPQDFIFYAGALDDYKGVHILLAAHQQLEAKVPLVLMGHGNDASLSTRCGVLVIRDAPHNLVMDAWSRCKLGVVPSLWPDPCPTTALEAMCHGKALIVSDIGGLPDIVQHGESGLLVPPGDIPALAKALAELITNNKLRRELGERAKKTFQSRFTADVVVPRIEQIYEELVH
jgi:glycosyltransferase involved in cell wall biosynthesis